MGLLLCFCVLIEIICHYVLKTEVVYTHVFYIPIVLSAYWWGLKAGLLTAVFLCLLHISPNLLDLSDFSSSQIFAFLMRGLFFVLIGFFVGAISESRLKLDKELIQSKETLEIWGKTLEEKVNVKTKNLSTLFKVSKVASSTLDLDSLLKKILNIFITISDAKGGVVSLIDSSAVHYCWDIKKCSNFECPAFEMVQKRCWEIQETLCCKNNSKSTKDKLQTCVHCEVFQEAALVPCASKGLKKEILNKFQGKVKDSICGKAILNGKSSILPLELEPGDCGLGFESESFVGVPLVTREGIVGAICLFGVEERKYNKEEMDFISAAARQVAIAIKNAQLYSVTETLALTDDLTELHNYRSFQNKLAEELERAKRSNHPLTISIIDLDGFKSYNDNLGHIAGNKILKEIASLLKNEVRIYDIVARYGGDEFCVIFPETDKEEAFEIADRVRCSIEKHDFPMEEVVPGGLTVSTGLATYPSDARYIEELIGQADKALYLAKNAGRNLIRLAKSSDGGDASQSK